MQYIIKGLAVVGGFMLMVYILSVAIDRNARAECLTWQSQAKQFSNYYLTEWQANQCQAVGVSLD